MVRLHLPLAIVFTAALVSPVLAQSRASSDTPKRLPGALSADEATELTNGWALIAQGMFPEAAARAAKVLAAYPRSAAALILAVEAEIGRGAAAAGLTVYERWLGERRMEEPGVLRRIALAALREESAQQAHAAVRLAARRALAADGDARPRRSSRAPPTRARLPKRARWRRSETSAPSTS
jgi:hypothetical protein